MGKGKILFIYPIFIDEGELGTGKAGKIMTKLIARFAFIILPAIASLSFAESSGGEFEILFSTIGGGGGLSTGGEFSLSDAIGQPDAAPDVLSGGEFSIDGGIWVSAEIDDSIFRDGFE